MRCCSRSARAAHEYRHAIEDVPIEVSAGVLDGGRGVSSVIRLNPDTVSFAGQDGRFTASLDVALFVGDGRVQIAEHRQRADLRLTRQNYQSVVRTDCS
jgi:hypothetical protein